MVASHAGIFPAVSAGSDDAVFITDDSLADSRAHVSLWNGSALVDDLAVDSAQLRDVWAASPSDVWTVGAGAWHRDAAGWTKVTTPSIVTEFNPLEAMWRLAANDIIALTSSDVLRWDGSAWSVVPPAQNTPSSIDVMGVYAASDNDVWAVGRLQQSGEITALKHWDGTGWTFYGRQTGGGWTSGAGNTIALGPYTGIWGTSANDIWAAGSSGAASLIHYDGTRWSDVALPGLPADATLVDVWSACPTDVWLSGWRLAAATGNTFGNSYIFHFDGQTWSSEPGPADRPIAITGSASAVWIVGEKALYTRPR